MDIQQLKAFIRIAELGTFSSAASELGITQSAISKRIALLESQVSQPLFDRISRQVHLTQAGRALLPRAKAILQDMEDTQRVMSNMNNDISGNLRIATSHHIGIHRLPSALTTFTQQYPDVHLEINFIDSERAISSVLQGDCELAFMTLSPPMLANKNDDLIQFHSIWSDPLAFVANPKHTLNKNRNEKNTVALSELAKFPAILPDTNTHTTQLIQALFDRENLSLNISTITNHLDAINMMISIGLGWSVLPLTLLNDNIVVLPTKQPQLVRQLGCIHHREKTLSNAARAMVKIIREISNNGN